MLHKAWNSKGEMPYRFPRSSVKFQGHTVQSITDFDPNWAFPDYRPVAAFKSLRFALFLFINNISYNICTSFCCVWFCYDYSSADSRLAPNHWEMSLQCNTTSHWLGTNLKSALLQYLVDSHLPVFFRVASVTLGQLLPQCQWSNPEGYG